jgi:hypothetical protein
MAAYTQFIARTYAPEMEILNGFYLLYQPALAVQLPSLLTVSVSIRHMQTESESEPWRHQLFS